MSQATRDVPRTITVCDICGEEIGTTQNDERGALFPVQDDDYRKRPTTEKTKHAWYRWPVREKEYDQRTGRDRRVHQDKYDFHALCLHDLVRKAVEEREARDGSKSE